MTHVGMSGVLGVALLCGAGLAGAAERTTVTALGSADASLSPDFVRLTALIQERGTKLDDLLKAILARGAAVGKQLKPSGAAVLTLGDPEVIPIPAEMRRQASAAIARLKAIKHGPEGEEVLVQLRVTAEFPLAGDIKAQLLAAAALRHHFADAIKQPAKEEDDAPGDDEVANMMRVNSGDSSKPGVVVPVYGRRLTNEVQKRAMQEAFSRAETAARLMAEAAGQSLGPLVSLARPSRVEEDPSENNDYSARQFLALTGTDPRRAAFEVVSPRLAPLSHRASVRVTFELKPK